MNAFEKDALAIQYGNVISLWVGFVAALDDLMQTYNAGHKYPAEVIQRTDKSMVLSCRVMNSPDDLFAMRTVTVSAHLIEAELVIKCSIQHWRKQPKGHPLTIDQETPIEFTMKGDRLHLDKQSLTPMQAAEKLLAQALLS